MITGAVPVKLNGYLFFSYERSVKEVEQHSSSSFSFVFYVSLIV